MSVVCNLRDANFGERLALQLAADGVPEHAAQTVHLLQYGLAGIVSDAPIMNGVSWSCIRDCQVSEWGEWAPCSQSCGGGVKTKARRIVARASGGGANCPNLHVEEPCNNEVCSPSADYKPIVNVYGSDFVLYEATLNGAYHDEGASCSDTKDGDISARVVVSGAIFPQLTRTGTYKLWYDCENSYGSSAKRATKTLIVRDGTCPVCEMNHGPTTVEASFPFIDAGVRCSDSLDGTIDDIVVSNPVDVERTGVYLVTYRARDATGNWNDGDCKHSKHYIRTVRVVDTLKPVLALHYNGKTLADSDSTALQSQYSGSRRLMQSVPNDKYSWSFGLIFAASMLGCLGLVNIRQRKRSIPEFLDV